MPLVEMFLLFDYFVETDKYRAFFYRNFCIREGNISRYLRINIDLLIIITFLCWEFSRTTKHSSVAKCLCGWTWMNLKRRAFGKYSNLKLKNRLDWLKVNLAEHLCSIVENIIIFKFWFILPSILWAKCCLGFTWPKCN